MMPTGIVLMGGLSRRMGADKAELYYQGRSFVTIAIEKLNSLCERVYLSVNEQQASNYQNSTLIDRYPDQGPLGGILTALEHTETSLLILGVDLPLITPSSLEMLIDAHNDHKGVTAFYNDAAQRWEPAVSVWDASVKQQLQQYFESGERAIQEFLDQIDAQKLMVLDPEEFTNINSPEDMDRLV